MSRALTIHSAAALLECTDHQIRRLIRQGTLQATGAGVDRRVSEESVKKYIERRKKTDIWADGPSTASVEPSYKQAAMKILKDLPALSAPRDAAKRLGLSEAHLQRLIQNRSVPVIVIGPDTFIPAGWLASILSGAFQVGFQPAGERVNL